jgi:cell division protein FtsB
MKSNLIRLAYAMVFLLAAAYAVFTLRGPKGVHALVDKQAQIQEMEKRNAELARDIERERERIDRLTNNPAEQDLLIHERLKLVRPGEKIYIIGPPDKK